MGVLESHQRGARPGAPTSGQDRGSRRFDPPVAGGERPFKKPGRRRVEIDHGLVRRKGRHRDWRWIGTRRSDQQAAGQPGRQRRDLRHQHGGRGARRRGDRRRTEEQRRPSSKTPLDRTTRGPRVLPNIRLDGAAVAFGDPRSSRGAARSALSGTALSPARLEPQSPPPHQTPRKNAPRPGGPMAFFHAPGWIRTSDLMLRRHALYPTELRARWCCKTGKLTSSGLGLHHCGGRCAAHPTWRSKAPQMIRRPPHCRGRAPKSGARGISRVLSPRGGGSFLWDRRYRRPRAAYPGLRWRGPRLVPYLALLRVGFAVRPLLPAARCALTAPFHPYLCRSRGHRRYAFCGTFRRPRGRPGVTRHPALRSSDFPPMIRGSQAILTRHAPCSKPLRRPLGSRAPDARSAP
jgi:hypothetical protein